jgi:hypothetical protein
VKKPPLSPALFALVCISFALPFATVSCDSAKTSFTGVQLITYTVPHGGAVDSSDCGGDISACVEHDASWLAILALVMAAAGLGFGVSGREKGPGWFATGGFLALLGIAFQGMLSFATVEYRLGFWSMLLLFLWAMCLHARRALRRRSAAIV